MKLKNNGKQNDKRAPAIGVCVYVFYRQAFSCRLQCNGVWNVLPA